MPATQGNKPSSAFDTLNNSQKRDLSALAERIVDISTVMRTANSIYTSDNFHLDARPLDNNTQYKVEIQFRSGSRRTVALVLVSATATNAADLRTAITSSASDGYIWNVT